MATDTNNDPAPRSCLPMLEGLQSAKSKKRVSQIDQARANGAGDFVSMPQILVAGDQSSGKSTALARLIGVPFPIKDGLCTRFPTEIIARRSNTERSITASVHPHSSRSLETRASLSSYN
ncbi:vacuolar sorting protein VPS1 [Apiospora aurea]|uniref:Vacuolar sorting protein VPS1 n=1 Tax=Apiospora aurea TaxID=335848 RepID=A0ABR1QS84_9PEZI